MVFYKFLLAVRQAFSYGTALVILLLSFSLPAQAVDLDTLRIGGDYRFFKLKRGGEAKECRRACNKDSQCKSWTFIKQRVVTRNGSKVDPRPKRRTDRRGRRKKVFLAQCRLKFALGEKIYNDCCTSGVKKSVDFTQKRKEIGCADYAEASLVDYDKNLSSQCSFRGKFWHPFYSRHYDWCMENSNRVKERRISDRRERLRKCSRGGSSRNRACERYSETAMEVLDQGTASKCRKVSNAWPGDYEGIYRWCKRKSPRKRRAVLNRAQNKLSRCLERAETEDDNGNGDDTEDVAQGKWKDLGCVKIGRLRQTKKIRVGRDMGRFTAVRLAVTNKTAQMEEFRLTFGNGRSRDLDIASGIARNSESKVFRFRNGRFIRSVSIRGRSKGLFRRTRICLQGKGKARRGDTGGGYPEEPGSVDDGNDNGGGYASAGKPEEWVRGYGTKKGSWNTRDHLRLMSDVNGDGKDDIVGFGDGGVYVSLAHKDHFNKPVRWLKEFGRKAGSWSVALHRRIMADVNGDGKADIVGFGNTGVYVALARRNGFAKGVKWVDAYGNKTGGWSNKHHIRTMADVNGDGKADIVGFADKGVYVSLARNGYFTEPELWIGSFGRKAGKWSKSDHKRVMADVNGDGKADIVGFGNSGVFVSLARRGRFTEPERWVAAYGRKAGGWSNRDNVRVMADVDGDGKADIVGFGSSGVYVSLARRNRFSKPKKWVRAFGRKVGGWIKGRHPRMVKDMDGDGKADIVGFANDGVYVSYARQGRFAEPKKITGGFGKNDGGWGRSHPRMVADIDGDKKGDLVGFGNYGVYVLPSTGVKSSSGGSGRNDGYDNESRGGGNNGNRYDDNRDDSYNDDDTGYNYKRGRNSGGEKRRRR